MPHYILDLAEFFIFRRSQPKISESEFFIFKCVWGGSKKHESESFILKCGGQSKKKEPEFFVFKRGQPKDFVSKCTPGKLQVIN